MDTEDAEVVHHAISRELRERWNVLLDDYVAGLPANAKPEDLEAALSWVRGLFRMLREEW